MNEVDRLMAELARNEDVIFRQTTSILRLLDVIDKLTATRPRTAQATEQRRIAARERAALVREMKAQGKSITKTALELGVSPRTVSRRRKD